MDNPPRHILVMYADTGQALVVSISMKILLAPNPFQRSELKYVSVGHH